MADMTYDIRRLTPDTTITVTVRETREWRLRLGIALTLFRLAAWVLGARAEMRVED